MSHENKTEDALLQALRALPAPELPREVDARVRRQALATLAREQSYNASPMLGAATRVWARFGVPAVLATFVGVYLTWAFQFVTAVH